jgi:hypothetical protein
MSDSLALERLDARDAAKRGWIHSPGFDLTFFILSPLTGFALAILAIQYSLTLPAVLIGASYLIGVPHYLASFAFFLGEENRGHARRSWVLFYVGPLLICVGVAALYILQAAHVVFAVLFVWNVYHVATQSSGIQSLYRRLSGGGVGERILAHRTILFANAAMAFWFIDRFPPLWDPMVAIYGGLPDLVRAGCLVGALGYGLAYAREISRRRFPLSAAETGSLATAIVIFTPYLWVEDSNLATLAMLTGHFIQYLAIVWLLNRRKYEPSDRSSGQRWLARVSASWKPAVLFMLVAGMLFFALDRGSRLLQIVTVFYALFNSLAFVHFYIDGLIWAFKNPYIRRTVGPFLTLEGHRIR